MHLFIVFKPVINEFTYYLWQVSFAEPFSTKESLETLASYDDSVTDEFWNTIYNSNFEISSNIEVSEQQTVRNLTQELIVIFQSKTNAPPGKYDYQNCTLTQIPSGRELKLDTSLAANGICDEDILVLGIPIANLRVDQHLGIVASSGELFNIFHSENESPPKDSNSNFFWSYERERIQKLASSRIFGALLYTSEDTDLAVYVRKHFAMLNQASGKTMYIFLIEEPDKDPAISLRYWKELLQEKFYVLWRSMGWLSSKPFDKSQAYEIGYRLGVYPDQLPCLVLFDSLERKDKVIFPIQDISTEFFRSLFSTLDKLLSDEFSSDETPYHRLKENYEAILTYLRRSKAKSIVPDRIEYNFIGKTVFINNPQGDVNLSNFQNE